jgi:hypothetical protein
MKNIKEIVKEFEEKFEYPNFGENTGDGDCFEVMKQFLCSSLTSLLEGIEKQVVAHLSSHNEGCECLEDFNMPCDCGVAEYNTAIRECLRIINSLK